MTTDVLAFWHHLEKDPILREQALLAGKMGCSRSAAAYLAGLAGGCGYHFSAEDYLRTVEGFQTPVVRTPIGPIRMAPGPSSFYLKAE